MAVIHPLFIGPALHPPPFLSGFSQPSTRDLFNNGRPLITSVQTYDGIDGYVVAYIVPFHSHIVVPAASDCQSASDQHLGGDCRPWCCARASSPGSRRFGRGTPGSGDRYRSAKTITVGSPPARANAV
jgi:hypothetical protein